MPEIPLPLQQAKGELCERINSVLNNAIILILPGSSHLIFRGKSLLVIIEWNSWITG